VFFLQFEDTVNTEKQKHAVEGYIDTVQNPRRDSGNNFKCSGDIFKFFIGVTILKQTQWEHDYSCFFIELGQDTVGSLPTRVFWPKCQGPDPTVGMKSQA